MNVRILVQSLSLFFFGLHSFMILLLAGRGTPTVGPLYMEATTSPVEPPSIFLLARRLSLFLFILASAGVTAHEHWITSHKTPPTLYSEPYFFGSDGLVGFYIHKSVEYLSDQIKYRLQWRIRACCEPTSRRGLYCHQFGCWCWRINLDALGKILKPLLSI